MGDLRDNKQASLLEDFMAFQIALRLQDKIAEVESEEEMYAILIAFRSATKEVAVRHEHYEELAITGMGLMKKAFVWWLPDESIVVVGETDEDLCMVGVMAPGTVFEESTYIKPTHEGNKTLN